MGLDELNDRLEEMVMVCNNLLDRCDEALNWVLGMSKDDRKIVWLRGSKLSWRRICPFFSCNKDTAKLKHTVALVTLQNKLG